MKAINQDITPAKDLRTSMMGVSDSTVAGDSQNLSMQYAATVPELIERASSGLAILNGILLGDNYKELESTSIPTYISIVRGVTVVNTVIGSFGLQVWDPSEPVLCSVAGSPTESTFYALTRGKIRKAGGSRVTILKADTQALCMLELNIDGIRFAVQYYQADLAAREQNLDSLSLPAATSISLMTAKKRKYYGDADFMRRNLRDLTVFQAAYRCIKAWAVTRGIYSSRLSYLSEPLLLLMVFEAYRRTSSTTWQAICSGFFQVWSAIDIERAFAGATGPGDYSHDRPPMAQTTQNCPEINFSNFTTRHTLKVIADQIAVTHAALCGTTFRGDEGFGMLDSVQQHEGYNFWSSHMCYIRTDLSYWGPSQNRCGRFVDMVGSEIASFATRLSSKSTPQVTPRVWPRRMIKMNAQTDSYEVAYFVGIDYPHSIPSQTFQGDFAKRYLDPFENELHTSNHFDALNMFTIVTLLTSPLSKENMVPDEKDWSLIPLEPNPNDSDDEDNEPSDDEQQRATKKKKPSPKHTPPAQHTTPSSNPLRPALDVLNRIRHDPTLDEDDHIIGYLDRHAGIMTMPVSLWKAGDATREEFIPQSRIKYFERVSDGVRIWDRERRLDRMFGSGRPVEEGT